MLTSLALQHFRSYTKKQFTFSKGLTVIVGPNTAGKSNLMEAIYLIATGKSFRAEKDSQMVQFGREIARMKAETIENVLEVVITNPTETASQERTFLKRFFVNKVPRRRIDFAGKLPVVLFTPMDLDIIVTSPSLRRRFLDEVLEQVDLSYRQSLQTYTKGVRQRNALLERVRDTGAHLAKQFEYWDDLLIRHGTVITTKRKALISFINETAHTVVPFTMVYDQSVISDARLAQYASAEVASATTLVGPHRDDFHILLDGERNVKEYGSRGQQRLVILQLKLLQLSFMQQSLEGIRPLLLLDDIFSELDEGHIALVIQVIGEQQTIMTTTHEEFLKGKFMGEMEKIVLEK